MTNVIPFDFQGRKIAQEERSALVSCTHVKEHLNSLFRRNALEGISGEYPPQGLASAVYTPQDIDRAMDMVAKQVLLTVQQAMWEALQMYADSPAEKAIRDTKEHLECMIIREFNLRDTSDQTNKI